jgi:CDP-diacylglycerol--glycerol-3-phosphate 3-phosphatidyltransferase
MLQTTARILAGWGVRANGVTLVGFLLSAAAGLLAARGLWISAAAAAVTSGVCDLLDGKVARLDPARNRFGALWDSSLDRYSDAFLIAGIGYYFAVRGDHAVLIAAFSAMAGSFGVSYVRARAEGLGFECRVGFWERGERWVLLVAGLALLNPAVPVLILAVATQITALRRLLHIRAAAAGRGLTGPRGHEVPKWSYPINWLHAGAALGAAAFWRWPA